MSPQPLTVAGCIVCAACVVTLACVVGAQSRFTSAQSIPAQCSCGPGRTMHVGMVSYGRNGDRQQVLAVEPFDPSTMSQCSRMVIGRTEIVPRGDAAAFHLERI